MYVLYKTLVNTLSVSQLFHSCLRCESDNINTCCQIHNEIRHEIKLRKNNAAEISIYYYYYIEANQDDDTPMWALNSFDHVFDQVEKNFFLKKI